MNVWYIAVTLLAGVMISGFVIKRFALTGLEYRRRFDHQTYFAGQHADMIEIVRNDRLFLLPWLRVESRLPSSFQFGHQENLDVSGSMYHRSVFFIKPFQQITRRHHIQLHARGCFNLGNATLTAGDLLGVTSANLEVRLDIPVLIYPRLLDDREIPNPFAQLLGDAIVQRSLITDPYLISGIRPYRSGDQPRDIHWPATARMQQLQVRTHDYVSQSRLLILLNSQIRPDQWDAINEAEKPMIEYGISMAATLCCKVLQAGLTAGFGTNMPTDDSRNSTMLLPSGGAAREEELLSVMARLRVRMTRSFTAFLQELDEVRGLDIIILSIYDHEVIREQMERLRLLGNTVTLIQFEPPEVNMHA